MSGEEFGDLDPRETAALLKRHAESERRRAWREYREAFLCLAFATNRLTKENGQPFALGDFMPDADDGPARPTRPQTPEQMLLILMAHNAAHGGIVH